LIVINANLPNPIQKCEINETIEFICRYESEEDVEVIWYCNRRQIRQSSIYSVHSDRRMTRITINRVQIEHAGEYTVEVINSGGKTVSSGKLVVIEGKRKEEEDEEQEKKQEKKKMKKEEEVEDVEMEDVSEEVSGGRGG